MAKLGHVSVFDPANEEWEAWEERLESYLTLNEVAAEKKIHVLLTFIGAKTYALVKDLCGGTKPRDKTYEQLTELIQGQLNPKPGKWAQRYKMLQKKQGEESLMDFAAALQKLVATCAYTTNVAKDEALTLCMIQGVKNNDVREKLIANDDMTFSDAVKQASAIEQAQISSREMSGKTASSQEVHAIGQQERRDTCWRCLGFHNERNCRFRNVPCHSCGKDGHIRRACRAKVTEKDRSSSTADKSGKLADKAVSRASKFTRKPSQGWKKPSEGSSGGDRFHQQ